MRTRPKGGVNPLRVVLPLGLVGAAHAQCYQVEIVPPVECGILGEQPTFGREMNEQGHVVGQYFDCFVNINHAFVWAGGDQVVTIDPPAGFTDNGLSGVNGLGDMVGSTSANDGPSFPYGILDGQATVLPILPGDSNGAAFAINDSRVIVGRSQISAVIWEAGEIIALDLPFGTSSVARAINQSGEIVGWMGSSPVLDAHAFLWTKERVIDLGVIPGGYTADAGAISNTGAVVGSGIVPSPDGKNAFAHAFYWSDGAMIDLGTLPGFSRSFSHDVNDGHTVVGECTEPGELSRGWVWRNGVMTDLNDLIDSALDIHIASADAINNKGQILVRGNTPDGTRSIILTPKNASPTDLTADCLTDMTDLMVLLDQWGLKPPLGGADFNADGIVNAADLAELLANWG